MKTRNILLLLLGLAMIEDQTSAASKHYKVESKGKQYLVETEGRTQVGKGDVTFLGLDGSFDTFNESKFKNDYYDYDEEDEQPSLMMMMISLLIKLQVEVESDPWAKSCPMALWSRPRTMKVKPSKS